MKTLIIILSILTISCSPQKRINRLTKNHPELIANDTIIVRDTVRIEAIHFDTIIKVNQDVSGVDSILNSFKGKIDNLTHLKLGNDIKYYITQRKTIEDTLHHFQDDLEVLIWQDENGINVKVNKPEQVVPIETEVIVEKYKLTTDLSWIKWLVILGLAAIGLVVFLKIIR